MSSSMIDNNAVDYSSMTNSSVGNFDELNIGHVDLTDPSNQIRVGPLGGPNTNISFATPASTQTINVPDYGVASTDLVDTKSNQSIDGIKQVKKLKLNNGVAHTITVDGGNPIQDVALTHPDPLKATTSYVLADGPSTVNDVRTFTSGILSTAASQQFGVKSGANLTVLTVEAKTAGTRTVTVKDLGADGDLVQTTAAQTISGGKTFSGANSFTNTNTFSATTTESAILFSGASGTPKTLADFSVDSGTITWTGPFTANQTGAYSILRLGAAGAGPNGACVIMFIGGVSGATTVVANITTTGFTVPAAYRPSATVNSNLFTVLRNGVLCPGSMSITAAGALTITCSLVTAGAVPAPLVTQQVFPGATTGGFSSTTVCWFI